MVLLVLVVPLVIVLGSVVPLVIVVPLVLVVPLVMPRADATSVRLFVCQHIGVRRHTVIVLSVSHVLLQAGSLNKR